MKITDKHELLVKINAPDIYRDADFVKWLNGPARGQATWHKQGDPPNEMSDLFFTFDCGEGSASDMPAHIWDALCDLLLGEFGPHVYCVVWLQNLEE